MLRESKGNANATFSIKFLWEEGFFKDARTLKDVAGRIKEKWGHNFFMSDISKALTEAPFLRRTGKRRSFCYIQKISPVSKRVESAEEQLFSNELIVKLGSSFKIEIEDLRHNFGISGNCTAFTLRKILEKEIFIVFAKNGMKAKLEEKSNPNKLIGLEAMVDSAAREEINGIKILQSQTAQKIKGIKFLGDISAHNPLIDVDMETILPQMPFIITAYKELAERL